MTSSQKDLIGVHIKDGIVQRTTTNVGDIYGTSVLVFEDGRRALGVINSLAGELEDAAPAAMDAMRCHGIGIACDLAGELLQLGRTKFEDPKTFVDEIAALLNGLADMVQASMRQRPNGAASFAT